MHLILLSFALILAFCLRSTYFCEKITSQKISLTISLFLLPPLLILTSTLAILCMGNQGVMAGGSESWWSYGLSLVVWLGALLTLGKLTFQGWQTLIHLRQQPMIKLEKYSQDFNQIIHQDISQITSSNYSTKVRQNSARLIDRPELFSGQIGFWQPELVITQGLLDCLSPDQLQAVLAHEQAHHNYRDTFWFFWLGWLRSITPWLPQTEYLWQELLLLREIRADAYAGKFVDPLLLAESLLLVVSHPLTHAPDYDPNICTAFSLPQPQPRLTRRIDALLDNSLPEFHLSMQFWVWLALGFMPLLTIPFHT